MPWSPGATSDDKIMRDMKYLEVQTDVVVTEKMDGENTTIYCDGSHARSTDSVMHPSMNMIKKLQARIGHDIPPGWRLCGENVYARYSIGYDALPASFLLFSIWDEHDMCLSWDDTKEWAQLLGLVTVPVLYHGPWDEVTIKRCFTGDSWYGGAQEGYVVKRAKSFHMCDFAHLVAKFVRPNHVQTDKHWMQHAVIPNGIISC